MMLSVILCEGKTDAVLVSYYLIRTQGWEHYKKKPPVQLLVRQAGNESVGWYKRGNDYLAIWGVGGKDNFQYAIENISKLNKLGNEEQMFSKVVILADKDDIDEKVKVQELSSCFSALGPKTPVQLTNRQWIDCEFSDLYHMQHKVKIGCLVVPFQGPGAIETFLLHVLAAGSDENENLIKEVKRFIWSTKSKFLSTERQRFKSEFATVLAIMYPEKVFTQMNDFLTSVPWENYREFQAGFEILEQA